MLRETSVTSTSVRSTLSAARAGGASGKSRRQTARRTERMADRLQVAAASCGGRPERSNKIPGGYWLAQTMRCIQATSVRSKL